MNEIERKFIFAGTDSIFLGVPVMKMRQVYLSIKPELRLRQILCQGKLTHFLTVKGEGDLSRPEYEVEIAYTSFEDLVKNNKYTEITKARYRVPIANNKIAIVDVFDNSPLITVEVEFDTKEEALDFEPLDWFGREITIDLVYKNKYIAKYGIPNEKKLLEK